jgi:hypothetical protein
MPACKPRVFFLPQGLFKNTSLFLVMTNLLLLVLALVVLLLLMVLLALLLSFMYRKRPPPLLLLLLLELEVLRKFLPPLFRCHTCRRREK